MRFVGVKMTEQQSIMMLHRVWRILMRQRTQLSNALRSHLAEFGIVSPICREGLDRLLKIVADTDDRRLPVEARASLDMLAAQLEGVTAKILENDRRIIASARATEVGLRLLEVPGIGSVLASAFVPSIAERGATNVGENDPRVVGDEQLCGRATDPARCAGHDEALAA
jgi:transposase